MTLLELTGWGASLKPHPLARRVEPIASGTTYGGNTIPPVGELYLQCTLATTTAHEPSTHADW